MAYYDTFLENANKKVDRARNFLQKNGQIDYTGYLQTRQRILTTAQNYRDFSMAAQGYEPMGAIYRGFSEGGAGMNNVANTTGVDVVDISILTSVQSFLPYLAVDRGMQKPQDLLTYQVLVADNAAGGFNKGEEVVNPFKPISRKLALSRTNTKSEVTITAGETSIDVTYPIAKGKTRAIYNGVIGEDVKGDGTIFWQGSGVAVEIDYNAGVIKLKGGAAEHDVKFEVYADVTSNPTGSNILKLTPMTKNITLEAEPNNIILNTSVQQIAYMNKLLGNGLGSTKEYGEVALQQLLNAFIYWINSDLVQTTWRAAQAAVPVVDIKMDMSSYYGNAGFDKFAATKNDKMNAFMLELQSDLLTKSNKGATYILVGSMGASLLANNSDKFVRTAIFNQQLNGVVGTYDGIPVLRHDMVTSFDLGTEGEANIILGHKDLSGAAAPVIYGEYLPLYSTRAGINFQNPTMLSQSLFNQSKSDVLVTEYITRGTIKYLAG